MPKCTKNQLCDCTCVWYCTKFLNVQIFRLATLLAFTHSYFIYLMRECHTKRALCAVYLSAFQIFFQYCEISSQWLSKWFSVKWDTLLNNEKYIWCYGFNFFSSLNYMRYFVIESFIEKWIKYFIIFLTFFKTFVKIDKSTYFDYKNRGNNLASPLKILCIEWNVHVDLTMILMVSAD